MKFTNLALATLAAAPAVSSAWSFGPSRLMMFPRSTDLFFETSPMMRSLLREQQALINANRDAFRRVSPRYELTDNDEKFQLAVDVPGVKMEDIDISLEENVLTISGHRESSDPNYKVSSRFSQSFSLDASVDIDKFTANLDNGVLVVSAPKDLKRIEANIRKIPIAAAPVLEASKEATEAVNEGDLEISDEVPVEA